MSVIPLKFLVSMEPGCFSPHHTCMDEYHFQMILMLWNFYSSSGWILGCTISGWEKSWKHECIICSPHCAGESNKNGKERKITVHNSQEVNNIGRVSEYIKRNSSDRKFFNLDWTNSSQLNTGPFVYPALLYKFIPFLTYCTALWNSAEIPHLLYYGE